MLEQIYMKVGFVTIRIIGLKVKIFLLTRPTLFSETSDKKNKKNYPFSDKYAQFYVYFDFY
tara:strand:+ start:421 stop:603 length:183 start_codon:yes stop_codon:yes gene_type:complete